jgi:hypothetical protein
MPTYRGQEVCRVEFDRKRDVYALRGVHDELIAELSPGAFRSLPQLRQVPHGRHRRAATPSQSDSAQSSGNAYARAGYLTVSWPAVTLITFGAGGGSGGGSNRAIEDAGIRAGEIVAHRAWRVIGAALFSVYIDRFYWPPGQMVAGDVETHHGIHGFKTVEDAEHYVTSKQMIEDVVERLAHKACGVEFAERSYALGTVELWGGVIEHARGYRAEFAAIKTIDSIMGSNQAALPRLRQIYNVE